MNSGDVFILDKGLQILQWNGSKSGVQEKFRASQIARALGDERKGANVTVFDETNSGDFFVALGSKGPINPDSADDEEWEKQSQTKLFRMHDSNGRISFSLVAEGKLTGDMLDTNDVFILDIGCQVFTWIGQKASVAEKRTALKFAMDYLSHGKRPMWLPITRVLEGGESTAFEQNFQSFSRTVGSNGSIKSENKDSMQSSSSSESGGSGCSCMIM